MLSKITKGLLTHLPKWMNIRKDPESVGAQFLDTFGVQFEDVEDYLTYQLNNQYIGTANLGEIDILYRADLPSKPNTSDTISALAPGSIAITMYTSVQDFYESEVAHKGIIDHDKGSLYFDQHYTYVDITVNSVTVRYTLSVHHVWNCFDEFGLLLGLPRLHNEDNTNFKRRILDVFQRPGSSTKEGLQNFIGRTLGIAPAHVQLDMMTPAFVGSLLNSDGTASDWLKRTVRRIGEAAPVTWRNASWDQTYWQILEPSMLGLSYLPHIWDAPSDAWQDQDFQSGIGDGRDLQVVKPVDQKDTQEFDYYVGLHGATEEMAIVYVPHSFSYEIKAHGYIPQNIAPPELYHYTIAAAEIVPLIFTVTAYKEYVQEITTDYQVDGSYTMDASLENIPGNQITSQDSRYVKLRITLKTDDSEASPEIHNIKLAWYDNSATPTRHEEIISTEAEWNSGDINGLIASNTSGGLIRLANTAFDVAVDTTAEWESDRDSSINIAISDNKITLMGVTT